MKTAVILSGLVALSIAGWVLREPSECDQWKFETRYVSQIEGDKTVTKREGKWVCHSGPLANAKAAVGA